MWRTRLVVDVQQWARSFQLPDEEEHQHMVELFGRAIHQTATAFHAFEHPPWDEFFHTIRCSFKRPTTEVIGGDLM
jgi:hypothetical protein